MTKEFNLLDPIIKTGITFYLRDTGQYYIIKDGEQIGILSMKDSKWCISVPYRFFPGFDTARDAKNYSRKHPEIFHLGEKA